MKKILSVALCLIMLIGTVAIGGEGLGDLLESISVKVNAESYYECPACGTIFSDADSYNEHISNNVIYTCSTCGKKYYSLNDYIECVSKHTDEFDIYVCSYCGKFHSDIDGYNYCISSHRDSDCDVRYCNSCKKYVTSSEYTTGGHNEHNVIIDNTESYPDNLLSCPICQTAYFSPEEYNEHIESFHFLSDIIYCPMCNKYYAGISSYAKYHSATHKCDFSGGIFTCNICKAIFSDYEDYDYHITMHTRNYTYTEELCNKDVRIESGYYICPVCESVYDSACEYNDCIINHDVLLTSEKPIDISVSGISDSDMEKSPSIFSVRTGRTVTANVILSSNFYGAENLKLLMFSIDKNDYSDGLDIIDQDCNFEREFNLTDNKANVVIKNEYSGKYLFFAVCLKNNDSVLGNSMYISRVMLSADTFSNSEKQMEVTILTPSKTTITKGDGIILRSSVENLPVGYKIKWSSDNDCFSLADNGDGTCTIVSKKSGTSEIKATVVDENGDEIGQKYCTVTMKSDAGFLQSIIYFFKKIFGSFTILSK